jgi:hypothetical protein
MGGEAPYTFIYRVNDGAFQSVSTLSPDSIFTISVPTNVADTFVYEVSSVIDGGGTPCLVSVDETFEIIVSPPPEALVTVSDSIDCVGGVGEVTITATVGTPEFSYTFNGVTNATGVFAGILAGTYDWYMSDFSSCDSAYGQFTIDDPVPLSYSIPVVSDVTCEGGNNGSIVISANGGHSPYSYAIAPVEGTQSPDGTFSGLIAQAYTITLSDANLCTYDTTIIVGTVPDTIPPVIVNCPVNDTFYTEDIDPNSCDQIISWNEPTATDNCSAVGAITMIQSHNPGDVFAKDSSTWVTYIFTDEKLNSDTCRFSITVLDNTPPVTVALPSLDSQCSVTIIPPEMIDVCDGAIPGNTTTTFPITAAGLTTVSWTFTDGSGNAASVNQIVFIEDDESPKWINGTESLFTLLNIECHEDTSVNNTGIPEAADNCSDVSLTHSDVISNKIAGDCQQYTITRTWTVSDSSGNIRSDVQTIAVADNTPPVIICRDTTVNTCLI